ncbi:MAG: rod shape-determining protein MreD [Candidatus Syntrophosphaera sp.]
MIWKHIWTFVFGLVCLYLQLLFLPIFELFGVIPNILIPWLVYLVWTREIKPVLIIVFIIGLLYDTTLPESFGLHALLFVIMAVAIDQFRKPFESESVAAKMLTLLLAGLVYHLGGYLVLGVVYGFDIQLLQLMGIAFIYNLAVSIVVFWILQFVSKLRIVALHDQ